MKSNSPMQFTFTYKQHPVYAYKFNGKRYDTGDKLGYIETIIDFALKDPAPPEKPEKIPYRSVKPGLRNFFEQKYHF